MLPIDLILIRHGESEENLAIKRNKTGDNRFFTSEFRNRPSRSFRLTNEGIKQAKFAGEWLKENVPMPMDGFYVSDYIRAKETAFYLDLPQAGWEVKYELRERDQSLINFYPKNEQYHLFGPKQYPNSIDSFFSYPVGGGESIAMLCLRLKASFFPCLDKERPNERVVVVSHGHVMRVCQLILEGLGHDDFIRLDSSGELTDRILNCQILWYTRCDPDTLVVYPNMVAVRSVCAHGLTGDYGWRRIQKPHLYSNENLMAEVQKYPRQFTN